MRTALGVSNQTSYRLISVIRPAEREYGSWVGRGIALGRFVRHVSRRWTFSAVVVFLAGCATITKGTSQAVTIATPGADGASCTLTSGAIGQKVVTTPATIVLEKSQENISVLCRKECFQDAAGLIPSSLETMAAGNLIAGGVVGIGIDAASGAMNKYTETNQFAMIPVQGCRPRA